ncbi:uncharacterized protein LOC128235765 [Mya arenaria]|uniref:uncharacterized protein LOC128235765 n=1 Tax=Mya arenaria TaxID=6604 RepID=UPI0022DFCDC4|nr:uncharacterized protein LOC128235765 [Mya arenaria]
MAAERPLARASSAKDWCWTINNYTREDCELLETVDVQYICYGREVGASGTPHLQGFMQIKKRMRMTAIKKIAPFQKAHLEKRRGTAQEAKDYTSKDDETTWVERGFMSEQGVGQLKTLTDMALKGHDAEDLYEQDGGCFVAHKRKIDEAVGAIKQCQEKKRLKTAMSEGNVELKTWQDWCTHHLDCQNDRRVLWIEDKGRLYSSDAADHEIPVPMRQRGCARGGGRARGGLGRR